MNRWYTAHNPMVISLLRPAKEWPIEASVLRYSIEELLRQYQADPDSVNVHDLARAVILETSNPVRNSDRIVRDMAHDDGYEEGYSDGERNIREKVIDVLD